MVKLSSLVLTAMLIALTVPLLCLPMTAVALADYQDDIGEAKDGAESRIYAEQRAKREQIVRNFRAQLGVVEEKAKALKELAQAAIGKCDREWFDAIKLQFETHINKEIDGALERQNSNRKKIRRLKRLYERSKADYDSYIKQLKEMGFLEKSRNPEKYRQLVNMAAQRWLQSQRDEYDLENEQEMFQLNREFYDKIHRYLYYFSSYGKDGPHKSYFFPTYPDDCSTETVGVEQDQDNSGRSADDVHHRVDDELNRTEIIKEEPIKPKEKQTARLEDNKPAQQASPKPACDVLGGEWRGGTLEKVRQIAADWQKVLSRCTAGPNCPIYRGRASYQSYMKTLMIWQCHATFIKYAKKASKDDRKLARGEACAIEKTLAKMAKQIKATGFMKAGANWKPFHIDLREKWEAKDPCDPVQIEEASSDAGTVRKPAPVKPVAEAKPKKECKGGGLVGAMDCVTKRIEEAGSGPGKEPAWASSTDKETGITIKSVANPDGSRTVTTTDKDGNILSREKVR